MLSSALQLLSGHAYPYRTCIMLCELHHVHKLLQHMSVAEHVTTRAPVASLVTGKLDETLHI